MKRYRLDFKRIFSNIGIILLFIIVMNFITNCAFCNKHIDTRSIVVSSNDTLWNLAKDICNNSSEDLNVQNIVIEIKNINELKSSEIYLGQTLEIPIYN